MTNICPHEMTGWLYYRYFPDALAVDLVDFPPVADLVKLINKIGFEKVSFDLNYISEKIDLRSFLQAVHRRDTCSQLLTISDEAYQAGLRQLQIDITRAGDKKLEVKSDICLLTLQADKPVKGCRLRTSRGYL